MSNDRQNVPNVIARQGAVSSDDVKIQDAVQPASAANNGKGIEIDTDKVFATSTLDEEAFMRDVITVHLADAQNDNDPAFAEITVNGDYCLAVRGVETKMRRYHLAVLAQAKQSRLRQRKVTQPDGSIGFVEETVLALTYPFQVIEDPNSRKGIPWLKKLLGNPG